MNGFKKLGEKIRFYREKKNISLEELAKLSGISEEKLRQIENGEIVYEFNTLLKLASVLEVELPDLLNFE